MSPFDRAAILGALLAAVAGVARAQREPDLDRIPAAPAPAAPAPQPTAPSGIDSKIYLQGDGVLTAARSDLFVPLPGPPPSDWEARAFLDARATVPISGQVSAVYSGRLNLRAEAGLDFPSHQSVRHDLREAYLAWDDGQGSFVDVGRINLKSGVALGFNPTDFFKTRAVVEPVSSDPSVLREDRLGALMIRAQHVFEGATLTFAYAPRLYGLTKIYGNADLPTANPMFDRTNADNRLLLKASLTLPGDISPEVLVLLHDGAPRFGLNLTRGLGQKIIAYVEWSGGDRRSLVADALAYGRETGTLPSFAPPPFAVSDKAGFRSDATAGFSYTTTSKITFNLEYQLHQAGFSAADWRGWFAAPPRPAFADAERWYIRSYAGDQQEPITRQALFLRADRQDAFIRNLELSGFVSADLRDGSALGQVSADYFLSRRWTLGLLASANGGRRRSDFGVLPTDGSLVLRLSRYF
ncbi:MAG: hypothetical protein ACXWKO_05835 [Phenylobacterium sp.]